VGSLVSGPVVAAPATIPSRPTSHVSAPALRLFEVSLRSKMCRTSAGASHLGTTMWQLITLGLPYISCWKNVNLKNFGRVPGVN